MTARLQLISMLGNDTSATLPEGSTATLRMFLTDLPEPSAFDLYLNGKSIEESAWNSGIGYEYNIPLKNLVEGTYTFSAKIYIPNNAETVVTTNSVTLTVASISPSISNVTSFSANEQPASSDDKLIASSVSSMSLPEEIGLGIFLATSVGLIGYYLYKKH